MAANKPAPEAHARRVRRGKPGDIEGLRRELWHAVRRAGDLLDTATEPGDVIRAANALAALGNAYRAATESGDLVARIEAIEAAQAATAPSGGRL